MWGVVTIDCNMGIQYPGVSEALPAPAPAKYPNRVHGYGFARVGYVFPGVNGG